METGTFYDPPCTTFSFRKLTTLASEKNVVNDHLFTEVMVTV